MVITWRQDPRHDPYYSHLGAAFFGSLNVQGHAGETFTVNWCRFDDTDVAEAHVHELMNTAGSTMTVERSGAAMLLVYGHAYPPNPAADAAVLERILRRQ